MAQQSTPSTPPAFVWDDAKVSAKVAELEAYYKPFSGKAGYNPHFVLHELNQLLAQAKHGNKSQEIYNAIMSIPKKEPVAPGCSPIVEVKAEVKAEVK